MSSVFKLGELDFSRTGFTLNLISPELDSRKISIQLIFVLFDFQDIFIGAVKDLIVSLIIFVLVCAGVVWIGGIAFKTLGPVPRLNADALNFFYEGFYIGLRWQIVDILPALISLVLLVAFIRTEQYLSIAVGTLAASEFWLTWYWHAAESFRHGALLVALSLSALALGGASYRWARWRHDKQVERIRADAKERLREREEQGEDDGVMPD